MTFVLGAELAGAIDTGWREKLALQFRLGWAHEYADVARPVTASFAGAPGAAFTVFGAQPLRDAAAIGLAANTAVAPGGHRSTCATTASSAPARTAMRSAAASG